MSSASLTPPWVPVFKHHLDGKEKDPSFNVYAFATLSPEGLPKVRHVIHRALTSSSNILITTTDTRMQKPVHLFTHPTIEIAWWINPHGVQFRITGQAYTIPSQSSESTKRDVEKALASLDAKGEEGDADWWEKERKRVWKESMSGHLRASFGRPPPGKPLEEISDPKEWPEQFEAESDVPEEQKKIDEAFEHFALLAIRVDAFEYLELKVLPNRRTQWVKQEDDNWKERKVAP